MADSQACEYLNWDSEFFGLRIARIIPGGFTSTSTHDIDAWCHTHNIDCLYLLVDAGDMESTRLAEDSNFRFVDIRLTFEKRLRENSPIEQLQQHIGIIRPHSEEDVPILREIAGVSYRDSRFYYDPNFPKDLSNALYETWIEKSCNGYADTVLVAEIEARPMGYISCHLQEDGKAQIGLVGVHPDAQGKGMGSLLVDASLKWFGERQVTHVKVVTQGRNLAAQRLYQRHGFLTQSMQLWHHKWFMHTKD